MTTWLPLPKEIIEELKEEWWFLKNEPYLFLFVPITLFYYSIRYVYLVIASIVRFMFQFGE